MADDVAIADWRLMRAVAELHRGFQRLPVCPSIAPSGMYWRCSVVPSSCVLTTNGAHVGDWRKKDLHYSSGDGWDLGTEKALLRRPIAKVADQILMQFPHFATEGKGRDWAYAGWLGELVARCWPDSLPYALGDDLGGPMGGTVPCRRRDGRHFEFPWPPPGALTVDAKE